MTVCISRVTVGPNFDLAEEARDEGSEALVDLTGTNLIDEFAVISQELNEQTSSQASQASLKKRL